jgi:predicted MFS family arabinose efflux permease
LPPLLTAVFLAADRLAPPGTAAEAFAWVATAFSVGSAAGAALAGPLTASGVRYGLTLAPAITLCAAGVLAVVASASSRTP